MYEWCFKVLYSVFCCMIYNYVLLGDIMKGHSELSLNQKSVNSLGCRGIILYKNPSVKSPLRPSNCFFTSFE